MFLGIFKISYFLILLIFWFFRTFDTDNSGFIDFKEFLLAINVTSSGTPEQKLEWAFRMYDIDGNGTIDEKEMIKIIEVVLIYNIKFQTRICNILRY